MPLYDCRCTKCGHEFEHLCKIAEIPGIKCQGCGGKAETLITNNKKDWFKPYWDPDFGLEPVFVRSRGHLKELCLKHNVTSRALGDIRNITEI